MKSLLFVLASVAAAVPASLECLESRQVNCDSGVHIIVARGTFEPQGASLQDPVVNAIISKIPGSSSSQVVYPASPVDITGSIASGVADAQNQINTYNAACPSGKIVLMGYSQGATVIGDAIDGGGNSEPGGGVTNAATPISQTVGQNVIAVVFFGDYNRVKGQGTDNAPNSCTVSGPGPRTGANFAAMQFYADRLDEYCDAADPVCCATGNNVLAHLGYFTTDNANAIANYVAGKYTSA